MNMITNTAKGQQANLKEALRAAHVFQDAIYQIAQQAMHDANPHNVAWIVKEHDKIHGILKNLHTLCESHVFNDSELR
jgi:hypothetical protein